MTTDDLFGRDAPSVGLVKSNVVIGFLQVLRQNRVTTVVVTVFLLLLAFIAWNVLAPHTDARLEAIRKKGYPVTLAELDAWYKPVPDSENAALRYMEAFALPTFVEKPGETFMTSSWPPRGRTLAPEDRKELTDLVADDQAVLQLLRAAQAFERSRYPIDLKQGAVTPLPHLAKLKRAVSLLTAEAVLDAADGQTEGAIQALIAAGRVADSVAEEPLLISQLVRRACWDIIVSRLERMLSLTSFQDAQLALLQKTFREAERPQTFVREMAGEQAGGLAFFYEPKQQEQMFPGPAQFSQSQTGRQRMQIAFFIGLLKTTGLFEKDKSFYLDLMATNMAAAELPFPDRLSLGRQTASIVPPNRFCILSRMMWPGLSKTFTRDADATARLRATQAALAVERFRLRHGHVLPGSLEELVPYFLKAVPTDPCDGKPLRFKKTGSGYVVYSIGSDGRDDGGLELNPKNPNTAHDITFIVEH